MPADELRRHQRALVALLIAATPPGGWQPLNQTPLATFVFGALRFSMAEGIVADDKLADVEAISWLVPHRKQVSNDFQSICAANAFGAPALVALAEAAKARSDHFGSGLYFALSYMVLHTATGFGIISEAGSDDKGIEETVAHFLRASDSFQNVVDPTPDQRLVEVLFRSELVALAPFGDPR